MKTKEPPQKTLSGPAAAVPTIQCPECLATIPIAEAVQQAVLAHSEAAGQAEARFKRQTARLKAEAESRLGELEDRLCRGHAKELAKVEAEMREGKAGFMTSLHGYQAVRDREADQLRQDLDAAKAEAFQKFQDGRAVANKQVKTVQAHLEKATEEQMKLRQSLVDAEARIAASKFDQRAMFEQGRSSAMETAQEQMEKIQKLLDEVRSQSLKREKDLDKKLAVGIREAEERGLAAGARKQQAALDEALATEGARLRKDITKEHTVELQRYETQIQRLHQEIESLHLKVESGPSEAIGDAAEEVLEREFRDAFQPDGDIVSRTKKGQAGADILITIPKAGGQKVLLESKWTQAFDKGWLAKAREDRQKVSDEIVVIVTRTLPSGVKYLAQLEDVWVTCPKTALALVTALRQGLVAVEKARRASNMDEARVNKLKIYLSGPAFRQQVEQIVSLVADLDKDLTKERTQHMRTWKENQAAFDQILGATLGIWTDLEIHSGQGLSPSEVLKPYLKAEEVTATPKRRTKAA
jgi:hypothetical protein